MHARVDPDHRDALRIEVLVVGDCEEMGVALA